MFSYISKCLKYSSYADKRKLDGVQYAGRSGRGAGQRLHRAGTAPQ